MEQPNLVAAGLRIAVGLDGRKGQACDADPAPVASVSSWPDHSFV